MQQSRLDNVFRQKKAGGDSTSPSASRGKGKDGKVVKKKHGSSEKRRGSLEGYLVQSTSQYLKQQGEADSGHNAAESVGDLGSLRQRNFALRRCSGHVARKLDKASAANDGEQAAEDSRCVISDVSRSKENEYPSEEAILKDAIKSPLKIPLHLGSQAAARKIQVTGTLPGIATAVEEDNQEGLDSVTKEFVSIFCSTTSAPVKVESSPIGEDLAAASSKRDPSPTTLNSGDYADRKKQRVSYKDLWAAASPLDNVLEEEHHGSPEKKARLSIGSKPEEKGLQGGLPEGDTGEGMKGAFVDTLAEHKECSSGNRLQLFRQKDVVACQHSISTSMRDTSLRTQHTHDRIPCAETTTPQPSHSLSHCDNVCPSETTELSAGKSGQPCSPGKLLCTPHSAINKRPASAVKSKHRPWSYSVSMFSPGDEFWNEAIQVVDCLLAPKERGNDILQDAQMHVEDEQRNATAAAECKRTGAESKKIHVGVTEAEAKHVHLSTGGLDAIDLCNEVLLQVESPLPVRHFNFDSQESHVEEQKAALSTSRLENFLAPCSLPQPAQTQNKEAVCRSSIEKIEHEFGFQSVGVIGRQDDVLSTPRIADMTGPNQVHNSLEAAKVSDNLLHLTGRAVQDEKEQVSIIANRSKQSELQTSKVCGKTPSGLTDFGDAGLSCKQALSLGDWLPAEIAALYSTKGVARLYPWQVECLTLDGVLDGKNLVYSASTSAGKSLVAEILMLRRIMSTEKKAILVLPYVALCSEKAEHLESLLEPLGKRVRSFFGTHGSNSFPSDTTIAVCTIEKANVLINKLLEEERLAEIAVIVIDELHMVGDSERGYLLELMLTKLRYAAGEGEVPQAIGDQVGNPGCSPGRIQGAGLQIVGMSATIANLPAVAGWLKAALYETTFRPVPLEEFIKVSDVIYNKKMEAVRKMRKGADLGGKDQDHVVEMCQEVVRDGHSVLVFCSSRKACEHSARHIAKFLSFSQKEEGDTAAGAQVALEGLKKSPSGLCEILAETLPRGVAYHHAGLTTEERELVEGCFKQGIVKVLTATSTLAAGVNLPARRVILRQPKVGLEYLDATRYKQMTGRAGRAGLDTKGESIIICKPDEAKRIATMMENGCLPLCSSLAENKNGMVRALLEVVASGIVQTANDVDRYVKCTLLSSTQPFEEVVNSAIDSLKWLCHQRLLTWDGNAQVYNTTPLGRAAFGSSLTPEESLVVFEDLAKAREGFVLASDLHLVYQVTPIYIELEPDWTLFYQHFIKLTQIEQAVGNRVGVTEPFLMRMAHGGGAAGVHMRTRSAGNGKSPKGRNSPRPNVSRQALRGSPLGAQIPLDQTLRVCRRFYVALMLSRLVQEVPLNEICDGFKVPRGTVQGLQERAGRFAGMVTAFCERLGWHDLEGLVSKFQNRVSFGVRSEIVELTEIPFVKAARARALYKAGYRTVQAVAEATVAELAKVLSDSSAWAGQDSSRLHLQQRIQFGMAKRIKQGARRIVLDKAEEARVAAFSAYRALGIDVSSLITPLPYVGEISVTETEHEHQGGVPSEVDKGQNLSVKVSERGSSDLVLPSVNIPYEQAQTVGNIHGQRDTAVLETKKLSATIEQVNRLHREEMKFKQAQNHVQLFGGFDIGSESCPQASEPEQHINRKSASPIDVDKMPGGFDEFFTIWQAVQEFAFDLHFTKRKDTINCWHEMEGIAVCWQHSQVYYVSFNKRSVSEELSPQNQEPEAQIVEYRWKKVCSILGAHHSRKISWDLKFQMQALASAVFAIPQKNLTTNSAQNRKVVEGKLRHLPSIELCEPYVDVRIAAWLVWPDEESNPKLTLEQMVRKRLPGEVAAGVSRAGRWINQMGRAAQNGCCRRAAQICALYKTFWKFLVTEGLDEPLLQLEMPLVQVLVGMETSGICIDMDHCKLIRELLERKMKDLESVAHSLAGMHFLLSAPADVANVLYKHLKLPVPPGCGKGKLHPSTDKQALDYLRNLHPIAEVIKEHRMVSKLLHGTVGSIISCAQPNIQWKEGCKGKKLYTINGHWLHTATATGRLAMEEPNLQCVEHGISFALDGGATFGVDKFLKFGKYEVNARDMFVPSQEGWVFMSADYSQIELRLMAHFSGDVSMTALLSKPSGDLFKQIAAQWTSLTENHVTDQQREQTKRLVYGILYGMGVNSLAEQLDCSVAEATDNTERFKSAFPGITSWLQQAVESCRKVGYIKTLCGRKRYLDKISTGNRGEQAKAERQAVNSICQGSAADLIKIAMEKVHSAISRVCKCPTEHNSGSASHAEACVGLYTRCRLLLQIHDELLLEVEQSVVKEAAALVRSSMQGAASLTVPLLVKIRTGESWGSLEPYDEALFQVGT